MSASAGRRRRSTVIGAVAAAVVTAVAIALVAVGAVALYTSTDGADAADDRPIDTFSSTPNGLLAVVDDAGRLASAAVITLLPQGAGGSIVVLPVSADASSGFGERRPLAETVALQGTEALEAEVEAMLRLDVDRTDVVDAAQLAELLAAIGAVEVDLPVDITDGSGGVVAEAGATSLEPADAAAVLSARDPDVRAVAQYPAAAAVWSGVADAVGDGLGDVAPSSAAPSSSADLFGRAVSGPLRSRGLRFTEFPSAENPRGVDVVRLDDAEVSVVFGQISPAQVAAPNPSLAFRVLSQYDDGQLEGRDATRVDVAYSAVQRLLFTRTNVISVETGEATAPAVTTVYVSDESLRSSVEIGASDLFGDVEVRVAERRIVGIEAVVELGESYLDDLDRVATAPDGTVGTVPASTGPATTSASTTESTTTTSDTTDSIDTTEDEG